MLWFKAAVCNVNYPVDCVKRGIGQPWCGHQIKVVELQIRAYYVDMRASQPVPYPDSQI